MNDWKIFHYLRVMRKVSKFTNFLPKEWWLGEGGETSALSRLKETDGRKIKMLYCVSLWNPTYFPK